MRRASSVLSPPRGVDTAGMAGLVRSGNDASRQAACDDTNVDVVRSLSQLPGYQHENPAADDNSAIRWAARNGRCGGTVSVRATVPGGVRSGDGDNYAVTNVCHQVIVGLLFVEQHVCHACSQESTRHILWNVFVTPAVRSRRHSIEACSVERFEAYYVERDCHACSQSRRQTTALQWLHRVIT